MPIPTTYTCIECGSPLAHFTPCPACAHTRIEEQSARGQRILDYRAELARAVRLSGLSEEEIEAFEIASTQQGRTRCVIWHRVGADIEKSYFYGRQPQEDTHATKSEL